MRLPFGFELIRPKPKTALHPDYKTLVEFAFEIEGVSHYSFKNAIDMPPKRFQRMNQFIREVELRMNSKDLLEDMNLIKEAANKGELTSVVEVAIGVIYRAEQFIETDTFYRLFTCAYFTLEEDLTDYDYDYNESKIELFKSEPIGDFFFRQPLRKYLPQIDISSKDFQTFSKLTKRNKLNTQKIRSEITKSLSEIGNDSGGV